MEELIALIYSESGGPLSENSGNMSFVGSYSTEAFAIEGFITWFEKKYPNENGTIDKLKSCSSLGQINFLFQTLNTIFSIRKIEVINHKINEILFGYDKYF